MNVKITKSPRIGNFIQALNNAIQIALHYNYNVIIPKHKFFKTTYIVLNPTIKLSDTCITDPNSFYYRKNIVDNDTIFVNDTKANTIIKDIFNLKTIVTNTKVIHIRGGDIFGTNPHGGYVQPPLSYYKHFITNEPTILISEDTKNPCVNKLLELYPHIQFKLQSLEEDIQLLLNAKTVIGGFGTFVPMIASLSTNNPTVYLPSYMSTMSHICNIPYIKVELDDYYKKMYPWKNTIEQLNIMNSFVNDV